MVLWSVFIGIALVLFDQLTKFLAVKFLAPVFQIPLIPKLFSLTYVENNGAAFGILKGNKLFLIGMVTVVIVLLCVYYYKTPGQKPYLYLKMAMVPIIAGALGNLIDRVRQGYVVDFFQFIPFNFPVFNFADIFVVIGTFSMAFILLFVIKNPSDNK